MNHLDSPSRELVEVFQSLGISESELIAVVAGDLDDDGKYGEAWFGLTSSELVIVRGGVRPRAVEAGPAAGRSKPAAGKRGSATAASGWTAHGVERIPLAE